MQTKFSLKKKRSPNPLPRAEGRVGAAPSRGLAHARPRGHPRAASAGGVGRLPLPPLATPLPGPLAALSSGGGGEAGGPQPPQAETEMSDNGKHPSLSPLFCLLLFLLNLFHRNTWQAFVEFFFFFFCKHKILNNSRKKFFNKTPNWALTFQRQGPAQATNQRRNYPMAAARAPRGAVIEGL